MSPLIPDFRSRWVLTALFAMACSAPVRSASVRTYEGTVAEPSPPAASYSTKLAPDGVRGGKDAAEAAEVVEKELRQRGDVANPDGTLANAAGWVLQEAYADRTYTDAELEAAARRSGFAGMVRGSGVLSMDRPESRGVLNRAIASMPHNLTVNRYGVAGGRGHDAAVVFGALEASLADIPRSVAPGSSIHLVGNISARYQRASVFVTSPSGSVREVRMHSRDVDAVLELPSKGIYKVEVMGYGATGPVVLYNVPVQVGATELKTATAPAVIDPSLTSERAEARLFELLNQARRRAALPPVKADTELRKVALAHSDDMVKNHFFSHVSPTTKTPDDRARRAGLRLTMLGECIAAEFTPESAHEVLMQSPAHRASMLDSFFTHVGIGVAFQRDPDGRRRLFATLLFGRIPPPEAARQTNTSIFAAIQQHRKARGLASVRNDPGLAAIAAAGMRALVRNGVVDQQRAMVAAQAETSAQVQRTHKPRNICQIFVDVLEPLQLSTVPALMQKNLAALGVAVTEIQDTKGPRLEVLAALEGTGQKPIDCQ